MKHLLLTIMIMVCALTVNAQTYTEHLQTAEAGKGKVRVYQSHDIDLLVNGKASGAEETSLPAQSAAKKDTSFDTNNMSVKKTVAEEDSNTGIADVDTSKKVIKNAYKITGYRVQIYAGGNSRTDKTKAETTGDEIKRLFPDQPVYVHFYSPRWICRMGNYRTYEEAQNMLQRVKEAGYKQASLVKGTITVTD